MMENKLGVILILLFASFCHLTFVDCQLNEAIDLTWSFSNETTYWKGTRKFEFVKKIAENRLDGSWYAANEFCAGEHGGTHFDAPYHFNRHGWKVAEVPLYRLIVPGATITMPKRSSKDYVNLQPEHLEKWQKENGPFPENCLLLVRFHWARFYDKEKDYFGLDSFDEMHFPGITPEAAQWIVNSKKFAGVGVDTASVDPGTSRNFEAHRILSEGNIYALENVKLPPELPANNYTAFVLPMKIKEGTGAPLRLVAFPTPQASPSVASLLASCTPERVPILGHLTLAISAAIILFVKYYADDIFI